MASNRSPVPRFNGAIDPVSKPDASRPHRVSCLVTAETDSDRAIAIDVVSLTLFDLGALATSVEPVARLIAGFMDEPSATAAANALTDRHRGQVDEVVVEVADTTWVEQQRGAFGTTVVDAFHIRPPWIDPAPELDPARDIVIDPGVAFGHGGHPSTILALELLVRRVAPGMRVTDIGTGTGVLAIVAARLGARVTAIESDPAAAKLARVNVDRNAVAERVEVIEGDASALGVIDADLVVANVTIDVQRRLAPILRDCPHLILSGMLCRQIRQLRDSYPTHTLGTIRCAGDWAGVECATRARARGKQ